MRIWGQEHVEGQVTNSISVSAGYFRRTYGNFTVTDHLLVTPADYAP